VNRITPRATNVPDPKLGYWHSIDTKNTKMGKVCLLGDKRKMQGRKNKRTDVWTAALWRLQAFEHDIKERNLREKALFDFSYGAHGHARSCTIFECA
jgi:hypothetical protein